MNTGVQHVLEHLEAAYICLAELRGLDFYEEGIVHANMAQVLDTMANMEAIL